MSEETNKLINEIKNLEQRHNKLANKSLVLSTAALIISIFVLVVS